MRGATGQKSAFWENVKFQSTRPMRGATQKQKTQDDDPDVSIHAPHAGRDMATQGLRLPLCGFNPRAPCGARLMGFLQAIAEYGFQSTRPMRGATRLAWMQTHGFLVSIHAPHAGRDEV